MSFPFKHPPAFRYWELALAGRADLWHGPDPIMHPEPQFGYWKARTRDGKWEPVVIMPCYDDTTKKKAIRGAHRVTVPAEDAWTYCAANPVSYEDYKIAYETGKFPGEISLPGPGHNLPQDERGEWVRYHIIDITGKVEKAMRGIAPADLSQVTANELANHMKLLLSLHKEGEGIVKANCEPWVAAQKAEKELWSGALNAARDTVVAIRAKLGGYLKHHPEAKLGGQFGARTGKKDKWIAVITDPVAFASYCAENRQEKVMEVLQQRANVEARGDREPMPGVEYQLEPTAS